MRVMGVPRLCLSEIEPDVGGARRDRTADLNTASVALSQLSYSPTSGPDFRRGAQQYGYRRIVSSEPTTVPFLPWDSTDHGTPN